MKIRELSDVDVESQRKSGIDKAKNFVEKLPSDATTAEQLDRLYTLFDVCAQGSGKLLDNFHPYKFFLRKNHLKPADELKIMLFGAFKASSTMDELVRAMDEIGRGKMNGHMQQFLEKRKLCDETRHKLVVAKELYLTNSFDRLASPLMVRTQAAIERMASRLYHIVAGPLHHQPHR